MSATTTATQVALEQNHVSVSKILTDHPEANGPISWDSIPPVLVEVPGGGRTGLGPTSADKVPAHRIWNNYFLAPRGVLCLAFPC